MSVPRAVISINEIEFNQEQDTNQYIKFLYKFIGKIFKAQFRRKATNIPVVCNFVCSNFIKALEYLEMLACVLSIDNVFTYDYMGNTYEGCFNLTSFSLEKNGMEVGGTKNYVVKANIDLQLQIFLIKFRTIQDVGLAGKNDLNPIFQIRSNNNINPYDTTLDPNNPKIQD